MDSSKISLKEGFSFLFEEQENEPQQQSSNKTNKLKILGIDGPKSEEYLNPNSIQDCLLNLLAVDAILQKSEK